MEALEEREEEEAAKALAAQAGSTEGPTEAVAQDEDEEDTGLEREHQPLPDLVVREPGDQVVDDGTGEQEEELALEDVGGAGVGAELESPEAEYAHYSEEPQEQQQEDPHHHYGHDRREEDLEQYCLDREDSDIPDETSVTPPGQVTPVTSLPATEEEPQQQQLPVEDLEVRTFMSTCRIVAAFGHFVIVAARLIFCLLVFFSYYGECSHPQPVNPPPHFSVLFRLLRCMVFVKQAAFRATNRKINAFLPAVFFNTRHLFS